MPLDGYKIRRVLLEVCEEYDKSGPGYFQSNGVLREVAQRLGAVNVGDQQAVLTAWSDLLRSGVIAYGHNLSNPDPPFLHFTENGRRALQQLSRDPYNPDGYLATVHPYLVKGSVALSYVDEAVRTFQGGCLKATAVMIGAAAESLVLETRDDLVERLTTIDASVPTKLQDWKVKTVRDAVEEAINQRKAQLDKRLYERFSAFWVAMSDQMRLARNDAGHPVSVEPVTHETVHAALLLFPEFASVTRDLRKWIASALT